MAQAVTISICIPAYKNVEFLKKLLDSIAIQTFDDYEVIICDDSPDTSVADFISSYTGIRNLIFERNAINLGTPENWNACVERASGAWIKIMHDDDCFASPESLKKFVRAISDCPNISLFYSSYFNVDVTTGRKQHITYPAWRRRLLKSNPATLLSQNIIGPPSVVIYRAGSNTKFDRNLKWLVDIEFYARYLSNKSAFYIDAPLINIGVNEYQVTKQSSLVREVEIPEYFKFLAKVGERSLGNILVYDAWWRLFRNLRVTTIEEIRLAGYHEPIPAKLKRMLTFQSRIPRNLLTVGVVSKALMFIHFLVNRS